MGLGMIVIRRISTGIFNHLPVRVSEWIMAYASISMGVALLKQPDMFTTSVSFEMLESWADEGTWAALVLLCGVLRLAALVVNGTFEGFRFSPHLRAGASVAGAMFWSQYCLGFLMAAAFSGGAWSGPSVYSTLLLLELANIYRAWVDIGKGRDR